MFHSNKFSFDTGMISTDVEPNNGSKQNPHYTYSTNTLDTRSDDWPVESLVNQIQALSGYTIIVVPFIFYLSIAVFVPQGTANFINDVELPLVYVHVATLVALTLLISHLRAIAQTINTLLEKCKLNGRFTDSLEHLAKTPSIFNPFYGKGAGKVVQNLLDRGLDLIGSPVKFIFGSPKVLAMGIIYTVTTGLIIGQLFGLLEELTSENLDGTDLNKVMTALAPGRSVEEIGIIAWFALIVSVFLILWSMALIFQTISMLDEVMRYEFYGVIVNRKRRELKRELESAEYSVLAKEAINKTYNIRSSILFSSLVIILGTMTWLAYLSSSVQIETILEAAARTIENTAQASTQLLERALSFAGRLR